jgi:glutamyl-tRNA synthetase
VVVDDHVMGVTHIIRGDDHLTYAGRQLLIYQAMGWAVPQFAHVPLIHGPDGAKLSKRHGATSTTEYANMGYLPEAMRNYLIRLGWSHGDAEIFSDEDAIRWFDLEHIGQAPGRLDFAKLNHVNSHYLRLKPGSELAGMLGITHPMLDVARAIESVKSKVSTLNELKEAVAFYLAAPTQYDEKAQATLDKGRDNLALAINALQALAEPWTAEAVKQAIGDTATASAKKLGELMPPMRAALVGAMSGPDIPEAMAILGKTESLARLQAALA